MNIIMLYFMCFIIYSVIGWIVETLFVAITTKRLVDRGFLLGPYLPLYGWGCLLMILYLTRYKDNIIIYLEKRLIKAFPDLIRLREIRIDTKEKLKELEKDIKDFLKKDD